MKFCIVICALLKIIYTKNLSYDGYKVYNVTPENQEQLKIIASLLSDRNYDFLHDLRQAGHHTEVMVTPEKYKTFENLLSERRIPFNRTVNNVADLLHRTFTRLHTRKSKYNCDQFYNYKDMEMFLRKLQSSHKKIAQVQSFGTTYNGLKMYLIKVSTSKRKKPMILIDGGIHAREWVAPVVVLHIIQQLVDNPKNAHLIANVDWLLIPLLNPDGYEYSRQRRSNRLWRKTRSKSRTCMGVDANRNFDIHWAEIGSTSDECSGTYHGPKAFSEKETRHFRDLVNKYKNDIKLYLTFHSYGPYILYPWGYTSALPSDVKELDDLGKRVAEAIRKVRGLRYTVGSSTRVLYAAAGGSDDWVKAVGKVNLSYTIELPGGNNMMGFIISEHQLPPICTETWKGILVYYQHIYNKFVKGHH